MVQMIKEVLRHKLQDNKKLSFDPEPEIQSQFTAIYPNGDISSLTNLQKLKAKNNSNLREIFHAINRATVEQVNFELNKPGILNADSQLNAALHSFREQFTATLNQELIFNPFYPRCRKTTCFSWWM